jgi:hypothetical protein
VNVDIARAYIDFYEVVFKSTTVPPEYYSATTTKGAGKRLSLRVPEGTYDGYLYAGHLEKNGDAVLLAQTAPVTSTASGTWTFTLTALDLRVNGQALVANTTTVSSPSQPNHPIYVADNSSNAMLSRTPLPDGIPYYAIVAADTVNVTVDTKVTTLVNTLIQVIPIPRKDDAPPVVVTIASSPNFGDTSGILTFTFTAPSDKGISNIGFDVEGMALATTNRDNGLAPVRWHIRNGIDVRDYDNGENDITNSGAGIFFAFGGAVPTASDVFISITPP